MWVDRSKKLFLITYELMTRVFEIKIPIAQMHNAPTNPLARSKQQYNITLTDTVFRSVYSINTIDEYIFPKKLLCLVVYCSTILEEAIIDYFDFIC